MPTTTTSFAKMAATASAATIEASSRDADDALLSRLSREISEDVSAFRTYRAEDAMKKRAALTSKDYDEFRSFVSVSELVPSSGRDVSSLFGRGGRGGTTTAAAAEAVPSSLKSPPSGAGSGASGGSFDGDVRRRKAEWVEAIAGASAAASAATRATAGTSSSRLPPARTRGPATKRNGDDPSSSSAPSLARARGDVPFDLEALLNGGVSALSSASASGATIATRRAAKGAARTTDDEHGAARRRRGPPPLSRDAFLLDWERKCRRLSSDEGEGDASRVLAFLAREIPSASARDAGCDSGADGDSGDDRLCKLALDPTETCGRYFRTEVDTGALGDVIGALRFLLRATSAAKTEGEAADDGNGDEEKYDNDGALPCRFRRGNHNGSTDSVAAASVEFATEWLRALAECGRFGLAMAFLTDAQQREARELCDLLLVSSSSSPGLSSEGGDEDVREVVRRFRSAL